MGCYTLVYANKEDEELGNEVDFPFMLRVFDYQKDILTSYNMAVEFILKTYIKKEKILFASESEYEEGDNFADYSITLDRLEAFFDKHPNGIIRFG